MKLYNTKTRRPPVILSEAKNLAYRPRYPKPFAALRVTTLPSLQEKAP